MSASATYVESYSKAKESIDLFENDTTSAFISKRSENKNLFRLESFPQDFNQFDGKKVYWSKKWADGTVIAEDGIPFVVVGDEDLECHYGPKCVVKKSSDNDQTLEYVHMELYKNMLYFARDPKHPYTDCKQMLRGLRNNELIQRFKAFNLAYHYTHAVLLKELILMMYMESCSLTYEQANEICQRTEINVTEERRRVTKSKQ